MAEDFFEESKITIEATLKEDGFFSSNYSGKLDLIYQKNGAEIQKESDIDVPVGSVKRTYDVPKVLGTEDTYNLKVIAKYGKTKEKTRLLVDATIWPKKVKLTVKDLKENAPAKHIAYDIRHSANWIFDRGNSGNTDENGIGNEDLKKSAYEITIKAPWEVVHNKNDVHKREHDIGVRCNPQAQFLKPDISKACYVPSGEPGDDKKLGVRQYVNAPSAEEGCDANNNIIEFEVSHKGGPAGGKSGDKIYIRVKFSKLSKRTTPKPALLAPCLGIVESDSGKTFDGHVILAGTGETAKFKVDLGYAGGETCTVTCGYSKDDPTDDKLIFTTWRKVTYQLRFATQMKVRMTEGTRKNGSKYFDIPDAILSVVKARLKPVFIEYENIKSLEFTPPVDNPCLVTKGFLEDSADTTPMYVIDEDLIWNGGATEFEAVGDDREARITFCDRALDISTKVITPTFVMNAAEKKDLALDTSTRYFYFVKEPFKADEVNVKVAAYKWKSDMTGVADTDQRKKPSIAVTFENKDYDDWREFQITEKDAGDGSHMISFFDSNDLSTSDKTALKNYYEKCFDKVSAIRKNSNQLKFVISGADNDSDDKAKQKAITDELNSIHAASTKVLYHPGLDASGVPREGPMSDVEIIHQSSKKVTIKLPKRAAETDDFKPGDFAGDPSATKCKVTVQFSITGAYTYNGHAGSGKQVLVLRNALPPSIASTICHELGHAMGMAVMPDQYGDAIPMPPGMTAPDHVDSGGAYYRDADSGPFVDGFRDRHQGPHCSQGMPESKRPSSDFDDWSTSGSATVCIMWGEGGQTDDRTQYCPVCTEVIKARDLRDIRSDWESRAAG